MPKRKKHNWNQIRSEYVEAPSEAERPTLEELASKWGCSPSYLREKASAEAWRSQADNYLKQVSAVRQEKRAEKLGTEQASWEDDIYKAARAVLGQIYAHLRTASDKKQALSLKEIDAMTRALARVHELGNATQVETQDDDAISPEQYSSLSSDDLLRLYQDKLKRPEQ